MNRARVAREVDDRLPRGIAGADDGHVVAATEPGFHFGGGVVDARSFEVAEPGQVEPPVGHAGRNQHAARAERRAVRQRQHADALVDPETDDDSRHVDARAKALRLQQRVACQLDAGDAGRKAQIVFDPRARACLAAGGEALEHEDVQSLGGAVDGRGKPRRAGADDDEIVQFGGVEGDVEARALGEIFDGGAPQKAAFAADDDGRLRGGNSELTKQLLGLRVALHVDPCERNRIPGREVAQSMRIDGEARSDDLQALEAVAQQQRAAQEEGLEDDFTELGPFVDRLTKRRRAELQHFPVRSDSRGHNRRTPGQQVDVARELLRLMNDDDVQTAARRLEHLDRAAEHDVAAEAAIAFGEQHVTGPDGPTPAAGLQCCNLRVTQSRKRDVFLADHVILTPRTT